MNGSGYVLPALTEADYTHSANYQLIQLQATATIVAAYLNHATQMATAKGPANTTSENRWGVDWNVGAGGSGDIEELIDRVQKSLRVGAQHPDVP